MTKVKLLFCCLGMLPVIGASGCATVVDLSTGIPYSNSELEIRSAPAGAEVQMSSGRRLITPGFATVRTEQEILLVCTKKDYEPVETRVVSGLNSWLWANLLNGGLGLIVDFSTGSAWKMSPRFVYFELLPAPRSTLPREAPSPPDKTTVSETPPQETKETPIPDVPTEKTSRPSTITLTWEAPEQNEDGSPLKDLAGYLIQVGRSSRDYERTIYAGDVTEFVLTVPEPGVYYIAITTIDRHGNKSTPSEEISVEIK